MFKERSHFRHSVNAADVADADYDDYDGDDNDDEDNDAATGGDVMMMKFLATLQKNHTNIKLWQICLKVILFYSIAILYISDQIMKTYP